MTSERRAFEDHVCCHIHGYEVELLCAMPCRRVVYYYTDGVGDSAILRFRCCTGSQQPSSDDARHPILDASVGIPRAVSCELWARPSGMLAVCDRCSQIAVPLHVCELQTDAYNSKNSGRICECITPTCAPARRACLTDEMWARRPGQCCYCCCCCCMQASPIDF